MRREKTNYVIQSVAHALDVLEQFNGKVDELGVTELSKRLKLHKNNVFRLLATLESRGYIEQNKATENYRLGIRSLQLGQTYIRQMGLLRQAEPILERLTGKVRENSSVAVLRGGTVVPVSVIESNQPVRISSNVGESVPLHATALGKAILAFEEEDTIRSLLGGSLKKFTDRTITDVSTLLDQLKTVSRRGYATERGEQVEDVSSVAVPVRDYTRNVVAALGIHAPTYRMTENRIQEELAPLVQESGKELSGRLGFPAES